MDITVLKYINELFDSYNLFSDTGKKEICSSIKRRFTDISEEELREINAYLDRFYEYCLKFANIIADKYKKPGLPKSEQAQNEIAEYVKECQKRYPEIDNEHIIEFFSTVCWLSNR